MKSSSNFKGGRYLGMPARKKIALIAHDNQKPDLEDWVAYNKELLSAHELYATGTTGKILVEQTGLPIHCFKSGPLGGDQQIGSKIAVGELDFLIFFWDPMSAQPHDVDVKALLRLATVYNIPVACNRATADFVISSPLMGKSYERLISNYDQIFGK